MKRRDGFTLIELLVVIAIIAILAAILFPVFAAAKERARATKCVSNLKQLSAAFQQYCNDFDGRMPRASAQMAQIEPDWSGSPINANFARYVRVEEGQLWPYVRSRMVYVCPTDYKVPIPSAKDFPLSYSLNWQLDEKQLDAVTVGRASKILMLIHEARKSINDGYFRWGNDYDVPSDIHYDGTTVSYCDGHARVYSKNELEEQLKSGQWEVRD